MISDSDQAKTRAINATDLKQVFTYKFLAV